MSKLILKQSQFYQGEECTASLERIENKYSYVDESEYFQSLVNFSTAKNEPYQRWVRYREGYSTALVDELIKRSNLDKKTHYIADPMVGSGSTIISAKKNGIDSFGVDVNPYCSLIVKAKLLKLSQEDIKAVHNFISALP